MGTLTPVLLLYAIFDKWRSLCLHISR